MEYMLSGTTDKKETDMAKPLNKIYTAAATGLIVALSGCAQQPDVYFSCTGGENGALTRVAYVFADDRNSTIHTKAAQMQQGQVSPSRNSGHSGTNYDLTEVTRVDNTFDPHNPESEADIKGLAAAAASRFCESGQAGGFQVLRVLEQLKQEAGRDTIQANSTVPSFVPNLGDPV